MDSFEKEIRAYFLEARDEHIIWSVGQIARVECRSGARTIEDFIAWAAASLASATPDEELLALRDHLDFLPSVVAADEDFVRALRVLLTSGQRWQGET